MKTDLNNFIGKGTIQKKYDSDGWTSEIEITKEVIEDIKNDLFVKKLKITTYEGEVIKIDKF